MSASTAPKEDSRLTSATTAPPPTRTFLEQHLRKTLPLFTLSSTERIFPDKRSSSSTPRIHCSTLIMATSLCRRQLCRAPACPRTHRRRSWSPANPAARLPTAPEDITITATAFDSDGSISKVEFFEGEQSWVRLRTLPTRRCGVAWSPGRTGLRPRRRIMAEPSPLRSPSIHR